MREPIIGMMSLAALMLTACEAEPVANYGAATVPDVAAPAANAVGETNAAARPPFLPRPNRPPAIVSPAPSRSGVGRSMVRRSFTGRPTTRPARPSPRP